MIKVFKSSGKNEHFILSNNDGLVVGCGEKYGLFLNSDLYRGETNCCDTFNNERLTNDIKTDFKIQEIEVQDRGGNNYF